MKNRLLVQKGLIMNIRHLFAVLAVASGVSSGVASAQAATDTFTLTGPDFANAVSFTLSSPVVGGHQGYTGGPDQLWNYTTVSGIGGWPDFFTDGKTLALEATSLATPYGNLFLQASNAFYSLIYNGTTPTLTIFGSGTQTFSLANIGWGAPGYGNTDTLTITGPGTTGSGAAVLVPGPIAGAGFPALLGLLGFGLYRRLRTVSV
jgi:hypothetical protein